MKEQLIKKNSPLAVIKQVRRIEALRTNLRKRKEQTRQRIQSQQQYNNIKESSSPSSVIDFDIIKQPLK